MSLEQAPQTLPTTYRGGRDVATRPLPAKVVHYALFPAVIAAGVAVMYAALQAGVPAQLGQMAVFAATVIVIVVMERRLPAEASWNRVKGRDLRVDLTSFVVLMAAVDPMLKALAPVVLASLLTLVGVPRSLQLFPTGLPFVVQLALAALIAEFGQYWMHRFAHEWPLLWRFHALHHSAERIYWLNGFRVHPLNMVWHYFAGAFVLMLLGAEQGIVVSYLMLTGVVNTFQHANIDLKLGFLNYVFSTNELHRWHHSDDPREANRNYGGVLIVWDLLFGTYHRKADARPDRLGLFDQGGYPLDSYWRQLCAPFRWRRITRSRAHDPSSKSESL
jgi:sterol desaturase/sphingolipid hydroxylase (fatty acid hydroxylase superfamily)